MAANLSVAYGNTTYGTTQEKNTEDNVKLYLKLCHVVNALILVTNLWIAASMLVFLLKTRRHFRSQPNNLDGRKMYVVCFVAVLLTLPRSIMGELMHYLPAIPGALEHCEGITDTFHGTYLVAVASTYFFLWLRQRSIYTIPMIREFTARWISVISWLLLVVIFTSYVTLFCVFSIPSIYSFSESGCILKPSLDGTRAHAMKRAGRYFIIGGFMILWQIILLSLFVYPLVLVRHTQSSICVRKNEGSDTVARNIRRSAICAAVAASSDFAAVTLTSLFPLSYPVLIATTLYDVSLQINIICIIATFGGAARIVTVFCKSGNQESYSCPEQYKAQDVAFSSSGAF